MKKAILYAVLVLAAAARLLAQDQDQEGGILFGDDWACMVKAPEGWIMDQETWAEHGIYALFYERGKTMSAAIPIIYVNTAALNAATDTELDLFTDYHIHELGTEQAESVAPRPAEPGLPAVRRWYDLKVSNGPYETLAYLRYEDTAFVVILAAYDYEVLEATRSRMWEVIGNLRFMDKTE